MKTPRCYRKRRFLPQPGLLAFKPVGTPTRELEEVIMTLDEVDVRYFCDFENLYLDQGEPKRASRVTYSRISESASARAKLADVIVNGEALRIEGDRFVSGAGYRGRVRGGQM